MADSQPIKGTELIEKGVYDQAVKDTVKLIGVTEKLEEQLLKIAEASALFAKEQAKQPKTAEDLEAANKALEKSNTERKRAAEIARQRIKLENQLLKLNDESIKDNVRLKVEIQERNKEIKDQIKQDKALNQTQEELNKSYAAQSKRLNALRKQYKDLVIQGKASEKSTQELLREIQKLDKELKDIDASVGQFQRSVGDYSKQALGSAKSTAAFALAIVGLDGNISDLNKSLEANEEGSKELSNLTAQAGAVFNTFANRAGKAGTELLGFFKEVSAGEKSLFDFSETAINIANSFNGVIDAAGKAADAAGEASDAQFELDRASLILRESLEALNGEFERQSALAGDGTLSFNAQEEAAIKAQRANVERLRIQEELAQQELDIIETRIAGTDDEANRFALESEASEKRIELQALQNDLTVAQIENEKQLREISRDRFERELDFAIDAFDAVKTVNERVIADDRNTLEERTAAFAKLEERAESSFQNQIKLLEEFAGDRLDINELVALDDEEQVRQRVRNAELDDVTQGRVLEIFRERQFVVQDLADAENDLNDAIQERVDTQLTAINDLEQAQIQGQIDRLNALEQQSEESINQSFDLQKRALEDQADFLLTNDELTAEQREAIQAQLQNDLFNLEKDRVDATEALKQSQIQQEREIADARIQSAQNLADLTRTLAGEDEEAQQAALALQKAVAIGEILINTQREISDIRADKDLEDNEKFTKITQAITFSTAAVASVAAQSLFDGTEDTGAGGNRIDDRGGFAAVLHPHERVMTAKQNAKVGDLSNDDLAKVAMMYNSGQLINPMTDLAVNVNSDNLSNDMTPFVINRLEKIEEAILNKPVQQVNVDRFGNIIETTYRKARKEVIKHQPRL